MPSLEPQPTESRELAMLSQAATMLAEAKSLPEVMNIRDKAVAISAYIKAQKYGVQMQNDAAEIKIRSERKAGEMLAAMKVNGERADRGKPKKSHDVTFTPRLADIGIGKMQSQRWQRVASIPAPQFETIITETKASEAELTTAGMLKVARNGTNGNGAAVMATSQKPKPITISIRCHQQLKLMLDELHELACRPWGEVSKITLRTKTEALRSAYLRAAGE